MLTEQEKWDACKVGAPSSMYSVAEQETRNIPGDVLEFGVSSGNGTRALSGTFTASTIYGFDSWQGLPEDDPHGWDSFTAGAYAARKDPAIEALYTNVRLIDGWFKDSLPPFIAEHPEPARFIVIDCDLYSSTRDVFDHIIVQPGTVIYFDEYKEYRGWEGREFKAFMEFIERTGYDYEYILRTADGGQCLVRILGK